MNANWLLLTMVLSAPGLKQPSAKDVGLEGEWLLIESVILGRKSPLAPQPFVHIFAADGTVLSGDGKDPATFHANYAIDGTSRPMRFDWIAKPPRGERFTRKGIFKVEGDTLTLCVSATSEGDRPTEFTSTKDPPIWLYTYKRVKKKD